MSERIVLDVAGRDTDECPDCEVLLESGFGEMGEQLACPECEERYVIGSVYFLERAEEP